MESEACPDEDKCFHQNYDDEHDSDVEGRLYAEVYYSNTIIGEENTTNNSTSAIQCLGTVIDVNKINSNIQDLLHVKNVTENNSNRNSSCDNDLAISNDSTNDISTNTNNSTKESVSTYKVSNLKNMTNMPNSKKRTSNSCLDNANKSSKKKKPDSQNDVRESHSSSSQFNGTSGRVQSHQEKIVEQNGSALINPYNKNVISDGQTDLKLLSREFLDLFFKKTKKKKTKDDPVIKDKSKDARSSNGTSNKAVVRQSSVKKSLQSNLENDIPTVAAVIDISSESSNESFENDSKYSTIVATDKKVKKKESGLKNNTNIASDSEESIFEVPVPPKPAPPLIEVRDSDNERDNQSDNEDSFLNDSFISQDAAVQNNLEVSLNSTFNTSDICEIISDSDDDSDNLILNCTEIQKGVSNLSEIKRLNQQTSSPIQENCTTNSSTIQHPLNGAQLLNNSEVSEKSSTSLQSKQKSKTSSKNLSTAEYFFRPMTEKMQSFYNNSWGGENFDMDKMKINMSNDPNKWAILNKDVVFTGPRKKRYFGMTCARCHKDGHRQNDCPEPNKGPTCHMCGTNGHFATYCPHTKCLTCGRQQSMYRTTCGYCEKLFCTRCRSQGHKDDSCPDLWRRYHHTTNSNAPKIPLHVKSVMKSRYEIFCCNCTKQGHDHQACKKLRWSQHFPNPSFVTHYSGPTYGGFTNPEAPQIIDDLRESPRQMYSNIFHCNNSYDSSMTPKTVVSNNFPRSNRTSENSVQNIVQSSVHNRSDRSVSDVDLNKSVIFKICGMKSKVSNEAQAVKSITLKLNVADKRNPGAIYKWKKLSDLLKMVANDLSAEFRLEYKDKRMFMYMNCSCAKKYSESLSKLIRQYASRSEFDRSQMLLSGEKMLKKIINHLSQKFTEMQNLSEDISTLYEKTRQLRNELVDHDGEIQNVLHNKGKLNELVSCQQKLWMLLYREGFGDESLRQLRKIFLKMKKTIEKSPEKRQLKKNSKFIPIIPLVSFKMLFTYLYYYNNVFVHYESSKLDSYIQTYRDNLDKRKKLLDNPLLFPQKTNETQNDSIENSVQNSISNEKSLIEDLSRPASQKLPNTQNVVIQAPVASVDDKAKSSNANLGKKKPKPAKTSKKKLNHIYLQATQVTNQDRQSELMQNFKNFVKNARNCVEKASKLNLPQLNDDIVELRHQLEDETYLTTDKVTKFRQKLRKATLKLQNKKPKRKKKPKKPPGRAPVPDNTNKKCGASL